MLKYCNGQGCCVVLKSSRELYISHSSCRWTRYFDIFCDSHHPVIKTTRPFTLSTAATSLNNSGQTASQIRALNYVGPTNL